MRAGGRVSLSLSTCQCAGQTVGQGQGQQGRGAAVCCMLSVCQFCGPRDGNSCSSGRAVELAPKSRQQQQKRKRKWRASQRASKMATADKAAATHSICVCVYVCLQIEHIALELSID